MRFRWGEEGSLGMVELSEVKRGGKGGGEGRRHGTGRIV